MTGLRHWRISYEGRIPKSPLPPNCRGLSIDLTAYRDRTGTVKRSPRPIETVNPPRLRRLTCFVQGLVQDLKSLDQLKLLYVNLGSFPVVQSMAVHREGKGGIPLLQASPWYTMRSQIEFVPKCGASPFQLLNPRQLERMELVNATMDASQVAFSPKSTGNSCESSSSRTDEALAQLTGLRGNEGWKQGQLDIKTVDAPIILSPAAGTPQRETITEGDMHISNKGLPACCET
ncbi:uncharacterized protein N7515_003163 [Penicillium bovifimosum]|uniref:Uncharacterized protein n=1 Tax=Penicillium bovifimosum TaxID=126998 RepID=A0A9W9L5Z0_9EURO|nr:uncharacterized protein N7515_003163 [Penicillium bovifimosum]KAJ5138315.1 hypothetical protein N7515_003163 [Penicillium bovifimosum]